MATIGLISFTRLGNYEDCEEFNFEYWYISGNGVYCQKIIKYDKRDLELYVKYNNGAFEYVEYGLDSLAVNLLYHAHGYLLGQEHIKLWVKKILLLQLLPDIVYNINLQMFNLINNNYIKWVA